MNTLARSQSHLWTGLIFNFVLPGSFMSSKLNPVTIVSGVTKKFGTFTALNDISLQIEGGECFGLLGPNGAGKSTLIRLLYGASSRNAGSISVLGFDPQHESRQLKKRLGVVTQEDALDEAMTVEENMLLYSRFLGLPTEVAESRVGSLLEFMNLAHKKDSQIQKLSGGMRRRLVFVRALINEPELLILDEPTTGLDPAVRQLIWEKIRELRQKGTTIILTTHYMDEAEVLCDRLVIIDRGAVRVEGAPRDLIKRHCPGFVAIGTTASDQTAESSARVAQSVLPLTEPKGQRKAWRMESASLHELALKVEGAGVTPDVIRPSNLEDVFLHTTGKELGHDA